MAVAILAAASLLWAWSIADVIAIDDRHLHRGEKEAWVALVLTVPMAGALLWLLLGRLGTQHTRAGMRRDTPPPCGWSARPARSWARSGQQSTQGPQ